MNVIDAHLHTTFQRKDFQKLASKHGIDFSPQGLKRELESNKIGFVVSITDTFKDPTPIGSEWILQQAAKNSQIIPVCGINPSKIDLEETRKLLEKKLIKGLKVYSGYYHNYPYDECYWKLYELAVEFKVPVIFHTGDTFSKDALLKYAHPLHIDEVAVKFPKLKIIMAHCGYPWVADAVAVVYKNDNVYCDISGMIAGKDIPEDLKRQLLFILDYVGEDKIIYGSDWPITDMKFYLNFMKSVFPRKYWKKIFYSNAAKVFGISEKPF